MINESAKLQDKSKEDIAADDQESLAEHMPDISDSDARVLALRMYYIELAEGVSNSNTQQKVGKMFLISSRTVKRWIDAWEMTEEEAITDQRSVTMHNDDHSILFLCPNLVFELRSWIRKRLKAGWQA